MPQVAGASEIRNRAAQRALASQWTSGGRSAHLSPSPLAARESSPHLPSSLHESSVRRSGEEPLTARGRRMGTGGAQANTLSERRAESQQQLRRRLWLQERHLELDRVRAELRATAPGTASQPSRSEAKTGGDATSSTATACSTPSGTDRRRLREELRRVRSPGAPMGEDPRRTRSPGAQEASQVERRDSAETFTPRRDRLSFKTARHIRQRSVGPVLNEESPERSGDVTNESSATRTRSLEDSSRCLQKARDDAAMRRLGTQTQVSSARPRGAKPVADGGESSPRKLPFAGSLSGTAGHSESSPSRAKLSEKGSSCRENSISEIERSAMKSETKTAERVPSTPDKKSSAQLLGEAEKVEKAIRSLQERKDRLLDLLDVSMPKEESQPTEDTDAAITSEMAPQASVEAAVPEAKDVTVLGRSISKPSFIDPVAVAALPRHSSTTNVDLLSASSRRLETNASASIITPSKQPPVVPALQLYKWHSQVADNNALDPSGLVWSPPFSGRHEDSLSATQKNLSNIESVQTLRSPRHNGGSSTQTKTAFPFASSPRLQTLATSESESTKPSSISAPLGPSRSNMLPTASTAPDLRRATTIKPSQPNVSYPVPQSPSVQDRMLSGRVVGARLPMAQMMSVGRIASPAVSNVPTTQLSRSNGNDTLAMALSPRVSPPHMVCHASQKHTGSHVAPAPTHAPLARNCNTGATVQRANNFVAASAVVPPAAAWRQSPIVGSSSSTVVDQPV